MLDACIDSSFKKLLYIFRNRVSGYIPVPRFSSQYGIPYTSANHVGFESCFVQRIQNLFSIFR